MSSRVKRMARLHALRTQLADAATAECRQLANGLREVHRSSSAIVDESAAILRRAGAPDAPWTEQRTMLTVAMTRLDQFAAQTERLQMQQEKARLAELEAVRLREQMLRMLEQRHLSETQEQERRIQAALDDAYSVGRVRKGMTMRF